MGTRFLLSAEAGKPPASVEKSGADVRRDNLVLKTMNREEMLEFILDGCEDALEELEPIWVQETPDFGFWNIPRNVHLANDRVGDCQAESMGAAALYGLLLVERDKATYSEKKYPREQILRHYQNFRTRGSKYGGKDNGHIQHMELYFDMTLAAGKPTWPTYSGKYEAVADEKKRKDIFEEAREHHNQSEWGNNLIDFGRLDSGVPAYWNTSQDLTNTLVYKKHAYTWMTYWSTPQDRAVRWAGLDGWSLAELRARGTPNLHPDLSGEHHNGPNWGYMAGSSTMKRLAPDMFAAAVAIKPEQLPPAVRALDFPELCRITDYTRLFMWSHLSADGSQIWPFGYTEYANDLAAFTPFFALDATANKNPVSSAYLSRVIQKLMWDFKRPHIPPGSYLANHRFYSPIGHSLPPAFYMVKNWGLPEQLPNWEEAQALSGGMSFFRYEDTHIHRNPYKVIQLRVCRAPGNISLPSQLVCNFSPTPCRPGHGMEFVKQFVDWWKLANADYGATSILGDYGFNFARAANEWRFQHWDDGMRVVFLNKPREGVCWRGLFSLGQRLTVILESATVDGKLAPMQFQVKNLDCYSQRAGLVPKVTWEIATADKVVPYSDVQEAKDGSEAVISPSAGWYDIDGLLAVAVPKPMPLKLAPAQFKEVRETLYFGPDKGGAAVIYSGMETGDMPALAKEVKEIEGLPAEWKGLKARAPEGYRVFTVARFGGDVGEYGYSGREPEGAPIFSVPTEIQPDGTSTATFTLAETPDSWSEEPRFYCTAVSGTGKVKGRGLHHRLDVKVEGGAAEVTVRFFSAKKDGKVEIKGTTSLSGTVDAAVFRDKGITIKLEPGKEVWLAVTGTGPLGDDRLGPFVDITAPSWKPAKVEPGDTRFVAGAVGTTQGLWEPIKGKYTFKADAADRSGVEKVEFYLNNGQLIGADTAAPYECEYEVKDSFCQQVYAVAYDNMGNKRKSFVVPFGDGTIGPSMMEAKK